MAASIITIHNNYLMKCTTTSNVGSIACLLTYQILKHDSLSRNTARNPSLRTGYEWNTVKETI